MAILEGEPGDPVIILANGAVEPPIMGPVGPFAADALTTVAGPAAATIFWTFAFEITGAKAVAFFLFLPAVPTGLTTVFSGDLVGLGTTIFSMMPAGANVSFSGAVAVAFFLFRPAPVDLTTAGALVAGANVLSSFGLLSTGLF